MFITDSHCSHCLLKCSWSLIFPQSLLKLGPDRLHWKNTLLVNLFTQNLAAATSDRFTRHTCWGGNQVPFLPFPSDPFEWVRAAVASEPDVFFCSSTTKRLTWYHMLFWVVICVHIAFLSNQMISSFWNTRSNDHARVTVTEITLSPVWC